MAGRLDLRGPPRSAGRCRASRIVRRRQWASGWPAANVRGTSPRRSMPVAAPAARAAEPKSTRRKFVTDGPTSQPASRRSCASRSRSTSTRATFAAMPVGSARAAVTIETLTVETEPADGRARSGRSSPVGRSRTRRVARRAHRPCSRSARRRGSGAHGEARAVWPTRTRRRPRRGRRSPGVDRRPSRRRRSRRGARRSRRAAPGRPVGLFGLQSQTIPATCRRGTRRGDCPGDSHRPCRVAGHRDDRASLLGHDPIHRVGRRRARRHGRRARNAFAQRSRISSAPAPDEQLVGPHPVDAGSRLDEPAVVGRRVLGQRRLEGAAGEDRPAISGGAGEVFRSNRRTCRSGCRSGPRPPRRSPPSCSSRAASAGWSSRGWGSWPPSAPGWVAPAPAPDRRGREADLDGVPVGREPLRRREPADGRADPREPASSTRWTWV